MNFIFLISIISISTIFIYLICKIPEEVWKWLFAIVCLWPVLLIMGIEHVGDKLREAIHK